MALVVGEDASVRVDEHGFLWLELDRDDEGEG